MTRHFRLTALALAAGLVLAASPATAAEQLGWIQSVSLVGQTISVSATATGADPTVYRVTQQTQLSGPEGAMTLSQLPSLASGSVEDFVMVSYEATTSGDILVELTLMPPLDQ